MSFIAEGEVVDTFSPKARAQQLAATLFFVSAIIPDCTLRRVCVTEIIRGGHLLSL